MGVRILIADKLAPAGARFLEHQDDVDVTVHTGMDANELPAALAEHDGVVVRSAVKITAPVLDACVAGGASRLRGIARAGVGVDNIDLDAATRHGIAVLNSASASTITTAEHAFALMIALARNIGPASRTMAEGGWDRSKFVGTQLHGKTLGVVGLGRIGQTVARRALAFGMNVIAFDPFTNAETALEGAVRMVPGFDEMVPEVDVVSFHVPFSEATANMLSTEQFARARPGLLVVNASRGGVVDEAALLAALESGTCAGAALDVYSEEPPPDDAPLRRHPNVLCTPHLGASTVEAQEAVAVAACEALLMYLRGERVVGAVNTGGLALDLTDRQRAFTDLAGRMVAMMEAASEEQRVSTVRCVIRGEGIAGRADTIGRFALAALLQRHLDDPVNVINAAVIAEQRHVDTQTVIDSDTGDDRLAIEIEAPGSARSVEGAIFADGQPRITSLDGYPLDMVPAGNLVLITNADTPGRIGLVGGLFGEANLNIAEMVIHRRQPDAGGDTIAMMILKLDEPPPANVLEALRQAPGILRVTTVTLPAT
ncbi:MAG: phosphoglycerate dehydrogenase [Planctomycetota bacterium]|jgi:D-3-phosphoglycerate dehydrogenase